MSTAARPGQAHYQAMANLASERVRNSDAYVALSVDYHDGRYRFAIWASARAGGLTTEYLDAENTSQERLEAHLQGFVENHRRAWADAEEPEDASQASHNAIGERG